MYVSNAWKWEHKVGIYRENSYNQLNSIFNQLKCSSPNLESIQEQCNLLQSWFNWLKCSWSLMGTFSRMM